MKPTQKPLRIVAAVLDTAQLILYKQDGEKITLKQGDHRIQPILELVTPLLVSDGYADIPSDLLESANTYSLFEEHSHGIVKFFKVAKTKLLSFFKGEDGPKVIGEIPNNPMGAINEILAHAVPATHENFHDNTVDTQAPIVSETGETPKAPTPDTAEDTIIAVVDNKIVPGVERIKSQFTKALSLGSTTGMEAFLKRVSSVIHERKHSVDDLLKFLERGDLPIAEDGSILIYKVLRKKDNDYVDCHTGKVVQKVGSYVCMDESMVDHDRRNECSNGLHVARRGYIYGFSGDVCVLAKLAPEDVIAVPEYDANKMRVCGYHIIFELTQEMYFLLRANKPITACEEGKVLLGRALVGDHVPKLEEVRITGHKGTGIQTSQYSTTPLVVTKAAPKTEAMSDSGEQLAPSVDPKEIMKEVIGMSRKTTAKGLYDTFLRAADPEEKATALQALLDFKRHSKVNWDRLGIPDPVQAASKKPAQAIKKTPSMTPKEEIHFLLPKFVSAKGKEKAEFAQDIMKLKQQTKKSWDHLGVNPRMADSIKLHAN